MIARQVLSVMFVFALIGAVPAVSFADTVSIEELAAGMADTPEDHKAVASYYRGKAEEARAEAQRHRKMGSMYLGGKYRQKEDMEKHCEGLSASYDALAKQYDALAADHDAAAQ